jgi:3-hydroxyisobutyrate dehydrogenase-like beta-hydroxyacid dehydrogenase
VNQSGRICLLGFGEVGQILAADLRVRSDEISAWDLQFVEEESAPSRAATQTRIVAGASAADAVVDARVVISAVTAAQDVAAARSVQPHLQRGAFFLDLNSVSPSVKRDTAHIIESVGARYVEAAIMAPIAPQRLGAPMLFGGPHAAEFLPSARELGFSGVEVFSDQVGRAAAAKMCRSIVVKGMEALIIESLLTARKYSVESAVIDSLANLFPGTQRSTFARYMISRALVHGQRRAEEMREAVRTVNDAGIDAWMSEASAQRQEWAAQFRAFAEQESLEVLLDSVLAAADRAPGDHGC